MLMRKIALAGAGDFVYIPDNNRPISERNDEKTIDICSGELGVNPGGLRAIHRRKSK